MGVLLGVIFYINYKKELQSFDKELLFKMQLCSYSLDCKSFKIDFKSKENQRCYALIKNEDRVASFYPIKDALDFYLELSLTPEEYHELMHYLHRNVIIRGISTLLVLLILSALFSFYALHPLRNSLLLTREFVKDILHDFNTPISTMRLNLSLLHREIGENKKLQRVERSIESVLLLQDNLRDYLHAQKSETEIFNLLELIKERVQLVEHSYPKLSYSIMIETYILLHTEKKSFTRVLDNLLSNASKYNKQSGEVSIIWDESRSILKIVDTGKGIQYPKRAFERFYKEHERGIGIGLHIVQKLSKELGMEVSIESQIAQGTTVSLIIPFSIKKT